MRQGKVFFNLNAVPLCKHYGVDFFESEDLSVEDFTDESSVFRSFLLDAFEASAIEKIECEGKKIFPWHYRNRFFIEKSVDYSTDTSMGEDEWRSRQTRWEKVFLPPRLYVAEIFKGNQVYATVDGGKTKLLVI